MSRFVDPVPKYVHEGETIAYGKLYFWQVGTTNDKTTWSDAGLTSTNTNPVELDGDGRVPEIWLQGNYRVALYTSGGIATGRKIFDRDNYEGSPASEQFGAWSNVTTYDVDDYAQASNGKIYRSLQNNNLNQEPSASPTFWVEVAFLTVYNANVTYQTDDVVLHQGLLYTSNVDDNTGNTPNTSPTEWEPFFGSLDANQVDYDNATSGLAATDAQAALDELDGDIASLESGKQPLDAELTALAGLTSAANKVPRFTGSGSADLLDFLDEDTLSSNSATALVSQQSVKAYIDNLLAANDAMVFQGVIDASTNPDYPAADRGHTYRISVAGNIGGVSGPAVEAGDILLCITDGTASGDHATVGSNWGIIQTNIDGAVITDGTQTLTNKTMDGGNNTFQNIPSSAVNNVATLTGTQTLTNKTMDGGNNTLQNIPSSAVDAPPAVTGFTAARHIYLADSPDSMALDQQVANNTRATIGPTGSGADYIWTELDVLPSGASAIHLGVWGSFNSAASGSTYLLVRGAKDDATLASNGNFNFYYQSFTAQSAGDAVSSENHVWVTLGSGNTFRVLWATNNVDVENINLKLRGFCIN